MRIAFLVLAHRNPDQVNGLLRQLLADPDAAAFVHVDRKSPDVVFSGIERGPRVRVLKERMSVVWGDISQIDATLALLRAARSAGPWGYVSLNSGQDLVVRPGLREFLAADTEALHLEARRIPYEDHRSNAWRVRWPRAARGLYDSPSHPYRLMRAGLRKLYTWGVNPLANHRRLPEGWSFHRGSQWFCVPGAAADWLLDYVERNPTYYETLRDGLTPDEFFFHTVLMNSPFACKATGRNLTYFKFGTTYQDNNHAVPLRLADVPAIDASGKFFARKFEPSVDAEVIRRYLARSGTPPAA